MFTGNYNFFDYKFNIPGYSGQDYGGVAQYLYLAISAVLLVALLIALRKTPREKARLIIGFIGIFMTVLYIGKTAWESYYDVTVVGKFNFWLLPFDSCSFIMPAAILAGFARGKVRDVAAAWVATGGIVGGFATMLFLNAFYYYPFLSFGAFYSMLWHFLMVFMGLLVLVSTPRNLPFSLVTKGYLFHLAASAVVIPIDFIWNFDFMLYKDLGGVPFFEGVASDLTEKGLGFLNPLIMLILYFAAFSLIWLIAAGIKNRKNC
ncbi:MAG: YwaF family protein [Clostridia bacterium]|nr:YwaF family protein [Clostridia bacterium]